MELEYKFYIDENRKLKDILKSNVWMQFTDKAWSKHKFVARYYDDIEQSLGNKLIALRVRQEDETFVLTIKAPGSEEGEFSNRKEWNLNWENKAPNLTIIITELADELPQHLIDIFRKLETSELSADMITDVNRYILIIETTKSKFELALDRGYLQGGILKENIYELEIELIEGDENELHKLAHLVKHEFNLSAGSQSKLHRCLRLKERSKHEFCKN